MSAAAVYLLFDRVPLSVELDRLSVDGISTPEYLIELKNENSIRFIVDKLIDRHRDKRLERDR